MRVVDKILRVVAVIASEEAKKKVFFGFSMVKILFLQKVLKKWSTFRKKIKKNFITGGGSGPYKEFSIFFFEPFPYELY